MTKDEPLPHPDIKIGKKFDVLNQELLECFDDAKQHIMSGSYDGSINCIELNSYKWLDIPKDLEDTRFEMCVYVLCHELEHWAQQMFLDEDEYNKSCYHYMLSKLKGECPFLEKTNFFASKDWEYASNGKYKRRREELDRIKKARIENESKKPLVRILLMLKRIL